MVAKNLIEDVLALPPSDRLDLVRRLWDSLRDDLPLNDAQRQELDRRYDEFLQDPHEGLSWEEVEAFIQAKIRS